MLGKLTLILLLFSANTNQTGERERTFSSLLHIEGEQEGLTSISGPTLAQINFADSNHESQHLVCRIYFIEMQNVENSKG